MKRETKYLWIAIAATLTTGCGHTTKTAEADSADMPSDTITKEEEPEALPDTAYASVELITPTLRILDTVTDGKINSYKDPYRSTPGIFAFRANAYRDGEMHGTVKGVPKEIAVDWTFVTAYDGRVSGAGRQWGGGSGWTGQPVYVEWPDSMIKKFRDKGRLAEAFSGKEIIVGSLSSNLYFIDFETGERSREPIYVKNPIKGSVMLDPEMNGNVYVGQGIPNERPFGAIVVDLDSHSVTDINPEDPKAPRKWGAYDSSAVRAGQFVFRPGENGVIYKFLVEPGKQTLHSAMSYTAKGAGPGIEASMSVYRNYGFTADNHGYIVCTNLDTMKPVWVYDAGDDIDSTPVIAVEDGVPYLYTGTEIDRSSRGYAKYVKLNALDGSVVWEREVPGKRFDVAGKHFDGGFYGTTLTGQGNSSDLIFVNIVENLKGQNGKFAALDRKTGKTVYEIPLKHYAWSSPVGFLNEKNDMYILNSDCAGNMYLIDAKDGNIIHTLRVGSNFESSPVVAGNSAVVGSRGDKIYKVSLK